MITLASYVARWCAKGAYMVGEIMDVLLHLGAHRTGTTTLQAYLEHHATALRGAGVACWTPERTRNGLFAGLIQRPQDITELIERRGIRSVGVIRVEMARLRRAGMRQLILSEENMIGPVRNALREQQLYPLLGERLLRFRAAFGDNCRRIALGIRSYEGYWSSALSYAVMQGHGVPDRDMLDRLVTQPRNWRAVIRDIKQVFPDADIVVWPFERMADRPDQQVMALTGVLSLSGAWPHEGHRFNPSRSLAQLRAAVSDRGDAKGVVRLGGGDGRWMPFDTDHLEVMRGQYQRDLAWLRQGADGIARLIEGDDLARSRTTKMTETLHAEVAGFNPSRAWTQGGNGYGKDIMV